MTTLSAKDKNKIQYTSMRTNFLLFNVGVARLTFQIRPHQYFQCFDFFSFWKCNYFSLFNEFIQQPK